MEHIKPGVVINGQTIYPEGWMYALDDALWQAQILQVVVRELKSADPNFRIS